MYGAHDVRVETVPDARIVESNAQPTFYANIVFAVQSARKPWQSLVSERS
jgi:hypothetical protein